jgi:hypothetical protein
MLLWLAEIGWTPRVSRAVYISKYVHLGTIMVISLAVEKGPEVAV